MTGKSTEIKKQQRLEHQGSNTNGSNGTKSILSSSVHSSGDSWGWASGGSGGGAGAAWSLGGGGDRWNHTSSTGDGSGGGNSQSGWVASVVATRGDGDHSGLWAVSGVTGDSDVAPLAGSGHGRGRARGRARGLDQLDLVTVWEWSSVVTASVHSNDWRALGVVVRVLDVRTSPEVVVGNLVVVQLESFWSNGRADGQEWSEHSEVGGVLALLRGKHVGGWVEVVSLTRSTYEEVVETSTFVLTGQVTDILTLLLNANLDLVGGDKSSRGEGGSSECELHCDIGLLKQTNVDDAVEMGQKQSSFYSRDVGSC